MTNITGENSLRTWLKGKPSGVASVISARAALRVAPLLAGALHEDEKERRTAIILPTFRALAAASFSARWPVRAAEIREAARIAGHEAGEAIEEASNNAEISLFEYKEILDDHTFFLSNLEKNVRSLRVAGHAVNAAVNAAQAVVDIVDADSGIAAADAATESAIAACSASHSAVDGAHGYAEHYAALEEDASDEPDVPPAHIENFWNAVEWDAGLLMTEVGHRGISGALAGSVMDKALWLPGIPIWAGRRWTGFKEELPENEEWKVWTDWYERHMVGRPASEILEFQRVTIPNDEWKRGPVHVNTIIAKLIEGQADPLVDAVSRGFEDLDAVKQFTSIDLTQYTQRIRDALSNDPYQVIGSTKDMLEATMKTILHRRSHEEKDNIKFPELTNRCLIELGLKGTTSPGTEGERRLRKIASSAQRMIETVNELRIWAGTGHGRVVGKEPEITMADANLVASTGLILAAWMLRHDAER